MNNLFLEPTLRTPLINFDASNGQLLLEGKCYPENAEKFFNQLVAWLKEYQTSISPNTRVKIDLEYFNTISHRCLLSTMELFKEIYQNGKSVQVDWYLYEEALSEEDKTLENLLQSRYPFIHFYYKS